MRSLRLAAVAAFWMMAGATSAIWPAEANAQARTAVAMAEAANRFLASLTPEQRAKAVMRFEDRERFNWNERPLADRKGLPLTDLNEQQTTLAMEMLKTGVGAAGYQEIQKIRSREPVLKEIRGPKDKNYPLSDSDLYYWSVFGMPSPTSPWGWRVEGHHISVNITVAGDRISNTPLFLGARPADLASAGLQGSALRAADPIPPALASRSLADVEDRARALVRSLDQQQRSIAIFDRTEARDSDMISGINNRTAVRLARAGLEARRMTAPQKARLTALMEAYLALMPPEIAAERSRTLLGSGLDAIAFAWSGGIEPGQWHYYTVQGPTFLIDYAQARDNATNHVHIIWRDFDDDFGD